MMYLSDIQIVLMVNLSYEEQHHLCKKIARRTTGAEGNIYCKLVYTVQSGFLENPSRAAEC